MRFFFINYITNFTSVNKHALKTYNVIYDKILNSNENTKLLINFN